MTGKPLTVVLLVVGALAPPPAAAGPHMTFRNNLQAGHLTVHRLSRVIQRKATRRDFVERLKYRQQAEWVRCNVDDPKLGSVMVYQMMVDGPAEVVSVRRGKKKISPLPPAGNFNLPKGSTRLHSDHKTPHNGDVQVPLTDPAQRAVLAALLDYAHWLKKRIEPGHRWQRDIAGTGIAGTQTFEFVDMVEVKGEVIARVTLYVEGVFEDPLDAEYTFGKGQAIMLWSRPRRTLINMKAKADYTRKRENAPEEFKLEMDVGLVEIEALTEQEQDHVTDQMIAFDEALQFHRAGEDRRARELCVRFRESWPEAVWMPAVDELQGRTARKIAQPKLLSPKQLDALVLKSMIAYEAAVANQDYDLLERTLRALDRIASDHRVRLKRLAKANTGARRGRAVFALAFSKRPPDWDLVQRAVRDDSSKVRAMALSGLAARRHQNVSADVLIGALSDKKASVRRRACQAVAACLPRDHFSIVEVVATLHRLLTGDKNNAVRREAARAVAVLGAPVDLPKLERALAQEADADVRREIEKAIEKLRAKDG